ncbi:SMI1/KNR4 family protein [Synechococcus sp. PCC 7336]|uniref:SMI1/KNR4 family protein n=1 Tax=Synechococcus sp. PCC 7336 TaxID=195250 RepID=UPI000377534D|nr:SMI1/KNR4 family protein [Synechococcus sp. PCC 7336]
MISNLDDLREALISSGIASEYQLIGCTPQELEEIDIKYGKLPKSYRQIMRLIGHRAGKLIDRREFEFYYDQVLEVNELYLARLKLVVQEEGLIDKIFIISSRYTEYPKFLVADGKDDSPVYVWDDDGDIKQAYTSVWKWIEAFIKDAQLFLNL